MNLAIALTAARYGAATANYAEVLRLLKTTDPASGKERVCGVRCRDVLTGVCTRARVCLPGGAGTRWQPPARRRRPPNRPAVRHRAPGHRRHPAGGAQGTAFPGRLRRAAVERKARRFRGACSLR